MKTILTKLALCVLLAGCGESTASSKPSSPVSKPNPPAQQAKPPTPKPSASKHLVEANGDGKIVAPEKCSPKIGAGGNYQQGRTNLAGKCENGGQSPRIAQEGSNRYLLFATSKAAAKNNTRTELAYTPMFPFDKEATIRFRFRIPAGAAKHPVGQMFYPLQIWQCSPLSPIAGMRLVQGTSHNVDFITRLQNGATPVVGQYSLKPGQWHAIEMRVKPSLNPQQGTMVVSIDGKNVVSWRGAYGGSPSRCASPTNSNRWRVKFGIYRSANASSMYEVHFDDFAID
jgi:hypothetical protein